MSRKVKVKVWVYSLVSSRNLSPDFTITPLIIGEGDILLVIGTGKVRAEQYRNRYTVFGDLTQTFGTVSKEECVQTNA